MQSPCSGNKGGAPPLGIFFVDFICLEKC